MLYFLLPLHFRFSQGRLSFIPLNHISILILTIFLSLLLVSRLRMFAFKFKDYTFKNNLLKFIFLAASLVLIIVFRTEGIALAVLLYILLAIVEVLYKPKIEKTA